MKEVLEQLKFVKLATFFDEFRVLVQELEI